METEFPGKILKFPSFFLILGQMKPPYRLADAKPGWEGLVWF